MPLLSLSFCVPLHSSPCKHGHAALVTTRCGCVTTLCLNAPTVLVFCSSNSLSCWTLYSWRMEIQMVHFHHCHWKGWSGNIDDMIGEGVCQSLHPASGAHHWRNSWRAATEISLHRSSLTSSAPKSFGQAALCCLGPCGSLSCPLGWLGGTSFPAKWKCNFRDLLGGQCQLR